MKKIFICFLISIICISCNSSLKIESNFILGQDTFYNKGYICKIFNDENKFCRIYFLNSMISTYIVITEKFKPNSNMNVVFGHTYDFDLKKFTINNSKIKVSKDGNLIIENIYIKNENIGEIELIKETNIPLDINLSGKYLYNGYLINIDTDKNKMNADIVINPQRADGIDIIQLDQNIILIDNSIISEFPLYFYQIDENNDLNLYPIIGNYFYSQRISYKLKRQS